MHAILELPIPKVSPGNLCIYFGETIDHALLLHLDSHTGGSVGGYRYANTTPEIKPSGGVWEYLLEDTGVANEAWRPIAKAWLQGLLNRITDKDLKKAMRTGWHQQPYELSSDLNGNWKSRLKFGVIDDVGPKRWCIWLDDDVMESFITDWPIDAMKNLVHQL